MFINKDDLMKKLIIGTVLFIILLTIYFKLEEPNVLDLKISTENNSEITKVSEPRNDEKSLLFDAPFNQINNEDLNQNTDKKIESPFPEITKSETIFKIENKLISISPKHSIAKMSLRSSFLDSMDNDSFEKALDEFSEEWTEKSQTNKLYYLDIFIDYSNNIKGFLLDRIECGELSCIASLQYDEPEDVKNIIKNIYSEKSGFDSKAMMVVGKNTAGFKELNRVGIVFATKDSGIKSIEAHSN